MTNIFTYVVCFTENRGKCLDLGYQISFRIRFQAYYLRNKIRFGINYQIRVRAFHTCNFEIALEDMIIIDILSKCHLLLATEIIEMSGKWHRNRKEYCLSCSCSSNKLSSICDHVKLITWNAQKNIEKNIMRNKYVTTVSCDCITAVICITI
jgi:hypothetical protein